MNDEYVPLAEAADLSGLHQNTLRRLLREGVIRGHKAVYRGKLCWIVSAVSLKQYTDPVTGFLLDLPGPKLFLRRRDESKANTDQD